MLSKFLLKKIEKKKCFTLGSTPRASSTSKSEERERGDCISR